MAGVDRRERHPLVALSPSQAGSPGNCLPGLARRPPPSAKTVRNLPSPLQHPPGAVWKRL
jgi:hypothetical protein